MRHVATGLAEVERKYGIVALRDRASWTVAVERRDGNLLAAAGASGRNSRPPSETPRTPLSATESP